MKPYYEHAGITIYHGDCREVLPQLESVDVVLTDPPWMASKDSVKRVQGGVAPSDSRSLKYGDIGFFDPDVIRKCVTAAKEDCFFLCGYKELPIVLSASEPHRGVFVWHKPNGGRTVAYPAALDCAFIVWAGQTSKLYGFQHWESSVFSIPVPSAGCMKTERFLQYKNGPALHPAQGPLSLYMRLLRPYRERGSSFTVLDTYSGTGTTLVAAKEMGISAIGVEIEERYCELAANRLQQEVFSFDEVSAITADGGQG